MVKVIVSADCGNAPKKLFLKQFNTAFAEGNIEFLAESVSDDIVWKIVGTQLIAGKAEFDATLEKIDFTENSEVTVKRIITHGKEAAANGEIVTTTGQKYTFCDFYEFSGAKGMRVKFIESYNIAIKP